VKVSVGATLLDYVVILGEKKSIAWKKNEKEEIQALKSLSSKAGISLDYQLLDIS
jgi:hypothetical protein